MESISVYTSHLTEVLKEVQDQGINIKLQNQFGHWSDQFHSIEEIKELTHRQFKTTVLILYEQVEENSTIVDVKSITGIELQGPFFYDGKPYGRIRVVK